MTSYSHAHQSTDAALWMQDAAEYRIIVGQIFSTARSRLRDALLAPPFLGAIENSADANSKPPAIVLDVDETLLDNGPWQSRRMAAGREYFDNESWNQWIMLHRAEALPGAVDYVKTANALGVEVFYITNRTCQPEDSCPQEVATIRNLVSQGFPRMDDAHVLMKDEYPEWGADKSGRRAEIAAYFHIIQIIGDDLGDFVPGALAATTQARSLLAQQNQFRFGRTWYLLPNPVYGSWKSTLGKHPEMHQ